METATGHSDVAHIDVAYVARLARIALTDEDRDRYQSQLAQILAYVEKIRELDLSRIEPTAHVQPLENVFRPDVAKPGLDRDTVLRNAPAVSGEQFLVPKIVE
jgi:aspartyl-tRNA(Asn)/glutamyl-tRNA(Gln) amidotransferase subunit C